VENEGQRSSQIFRGERAKRMVLGTKSPSRVQRHSAWWELGRQAIRSLGQKLPAQLTSSFAQSALASTTRASSRPANFFSRKWHEEGRNPGCGPHVV